MKLNGMVRKAKTKQDRRGGAVDSAWFFRDEGLIIKPIGVSEVRWRRLGGSIQTTKLGNCAIKPLKPLYIIIAHGHLRSSGPYYMPALMVVV